MSETEEKRLWAWKFQLHKQTKQGEIKENTSHKSCDEPWKEGAEVITKKGVHKHNKSAQTHNIHNKALLEIHSQPGEYEEFLGA